MGNQAPEAALGRATSDVKRLGSLSNAIGDLAVVRVGPPVAPRQLDVERSAIAVERLPRDRVEHVLLQRDIAAFGALSLVIWAAIGQWATMRLARSPALAGCEPSAVVRDPQWGGSADDAATASARPFRPAIGFAVRIRTISDDPTS
jgi:hypothetical protein